MLLVLLILLSACSSQPPAEISQQTALPATVSPSLPPAPSSEATIEATVEATTEVTAAPDATDEPLGTMLPLITETVTLAQPQPLQNTEIVDRPLRNLRALTDGSRKYKLALWSPDADWIAATPQDGPGLDAINVSSGEVRAIVTDTFVLEPVWLDATTLLVHRVAEDGDQLVQVTLTEQGTETDPLVTNAPPLRAVSTGGSVWAFSTAEQLFVLNQPTRQDIPLPLPALITAPSPQTEDGLTVAINPVVTNLESVTTLLVHITGPRAGDRATITPLSSADEGLWLPRWSRDGSKLALTSIEGRIFSSTPDGNERYNLGPGDLPAWSPDGTRLAYAGTSAGLEFLDRDIHIVDWRGKEARLRLTDANEEQFFTSPSWSPDGTQIACVEIDDGKIYVGTLPAR
ncbi:MAG: PD40 domain-containing protein [Chloroflexi bacterium]|nr:PD40 domain-containing protein [Chloroflexota bacterium]